MTLKPILQALLVADHIYEDKTTGKKVVAGIFHRLILAPTAERSDQSGDDDPAGAEERELTRIAPSEVQQVGSPYAYVSLTGVRGKTPFVLRYVSLGDERVYFQAEITIECHDPLQTVEAVIPLPPLPRPRPGIFALELLCEDEPIGSFRVAVEQLKIEGQEHDSN